MRADIFISVSKEAEAVSVTEPEKAVSSQPAADTATPRPSSAADNTSGKKTEEKSASRTENRTTVKTENTTSTTSSQATQPAQQSFDVNRYVEYARNYGRKIGLIPDATATACWDDPITANAHSKHLERDLKDRLDWYLASGYTAFHVWTEKLSKESYLIYIGYA